MENKKGYLTEELLDELKNLKGKISANQARKRFRIGHDKLMKIWGNNRQITRENQITKVDDNSHILDDNQIEPASNLLPTVNDRIYQERPTPEDLIYNLETIAEQSRKQTELLSRLLEQQGEEKDNIEELLEQDTQSEILEEEEKQTITMQDIGKMVAEFKTLGYVYAGIMTVVSVLAITWKHTKSNNDGKPPPTAGLSGAKPVETTRPSLFKKEPDPFEFN